MRCPAHAHLLLKLFHDPELSPMFLVLLPLCLRRPPPKASEASSSGTAALSIIPPSAENIGGQPWSINSLNVRGVDRRERGGGACHRLTDETGCFGLF